MRLAAIAAVLCLAGVAHAAQPEKLGEAFRAYDEGDVERAAVLLDEMDTRYLVNDDYFFWLRGHVELLRGRTEVALASFEALRDQAGTRFADEVPWRIADCKWDLGQRQAAIASYRSLLGRGDAAEHADLAVVRMRIAEVEGKRSSYREVLIEHPAHPLAVTAAAYAPAPLTAEERLARARNLTAAHLWHEAIAELMLIPDTPAIHVRRTYWLGTTLYKMRRRYGEAGELLLSVYDDMDSAEAMFHGARALSRADRDDEAITWYRKVVARYPATIYAEEAQYLSGWLEFNRGNFDKALPGLEKMLELYPTSKWADDALWHLGMAKYLLGKHKAALVHLERLAARGGAYEGGKGRYWSARTYDQLGKADKASSLYRGLVERWPFSWYALLARARLAERGVTIGPFGDDAPAPRGPAIATTVDEGLADDALIAGADELIAAGLTVEAGAELERGERAFLKRHDRAKAFAMLLDRYAKADNHHRPWMLALVHADEALRGPAEGSAEVWWRYAYPRAYRELVERWQQVGGCPDDYLYSIMRIESGFNPHDLSYADAQGLLQMIPATTRRVAAALGEPYDPGKLYDPEFNIKTGAYYIGSLLTKFKGQIPIGAGSFNSGPRPVMRWLDRNGARPMDEFVELVTYAQTREYMKKATENYARYVYVYQDKLYEQPLAVDAAYVVDDLTY